MIVPFNRNSEALQIMWPSSTFDAVKQRLLDNARGRETTYEYALKKDDSAPVVALYTGHGPSILFKAPPAPMDRLFAAWLGNHAGDIHTLHANGTKLSICGTFTCDASGNEALNIYYVVRDDRVIVDEDTLRQIVKESSRVRVEPIIGAYNITVATAAVGSVDFGEFNPAKTKFLGFAVTDVDNGGVSASVTNHLYRSFCDARPSSLGWSPPAR